MTLSRRHFLTRSAVIGCSAAASPLLTPVSFAAAPWDTRLVVIILRGGMDGLDMLQPYGDPNYAGLRTTLAGGPENGGLDLDGFYAMHQGLAPLLPLWKRQELGFVQAVSIPYRDRRSHFDGQDLLEAGTTELGQVGDGWLNRMLQHMSGVETRTAFAIGQGEMKLLQGPAQVSDWSPDAALSLSPQAKLLAEQMMRNDPLFHAALAEALELSQDGSMMLGQAESDEAMEEMTMPSPSRGKSHLKIAEFAAEQLRNETRVAAFSINGWDTHSNQTRGLGSAFRRLSDTILTLRDGLGGAIWGKTAILAMTEFGRTARENGTKGTDHGTGGAMLLSGGAIRGGRVHGRWPGLAEVDLFDRRDLMPTTDVRAQAAWIMRGLIGVDRSQLEQVVFPGLDMGNDPGLLL
ncbi:twin-arginine translocation pathway signal [Sedimentitalea sp. CY04]|uniref:Twin-arginine translocation pathway signal n=1 Tax=Parasedimentitalea denitrificans TaxID=2211118 RepID=A0ABX0W888_9RHOB|nr:DUF1501 domain-containing protein [Sedimentitalea sp. CY04]NIZ61822.1 twin-arginine translocation pathway signal [Sedimentitalea sp. CY04]